MAVSNTDLLKNRLDPRGAAIYDPTMNYQSPGEYRNTQEDFNRKYEENIRGIAQYNDVDFGVAREMFYTNALNGTGEYKGGGVVDGATWGQMMKDAQNIHSVATKSAIDKGYDPSTGRKFAQDDYYGGGSYGGGGGGGSYGGGGGPQMPALPTMRSGKSMAELLGVIYDYDKIKGDWTDAAEKKYANLDNEFGRTQDMYYDSVANNADMLMGAMRRGDRDAVISGTSEGTKAAQEMSTLLGVSADSAQGATELAHGRSDLISQRETELANITKDAMKYYNELGLNLGQLSASELNALTQAYAAQVATAGGIYNTDVLASVERDRIASTEKIASGDNVTRENIAQWGNASNEAIAAANNMTAKEVEQMRGEWNKAIAATNASSYRSSGGSYAKYNGGPVASGSKSAMDLDTKLSGLFGARLDALQLDTPEGRRMVAAYDAEIAKLLGMDYNELTKSKVHQALDRGDLPISEGHYYVKPPTGKPMTSDEILSEALKNLKDFSGKKR